MGLIVHQKNIKEAILSGDVAPKQKVATDALYHVRVAAIVTPLNAPPQGYRAFIRGNKVMTNVQAQYVAQLADNISNSPIQAGTDKQNRPTWIGARFSA
jgi:hypothetical protein